LKLRFNRLVDQFEVPKNGDFGCHDESGGLDPAASAALVGGVRADHKVTVHDSVGNTGTVAITTKNQDNTDATWTLWGSVDYTKANGGGNNTAFTFSTTQNCLWATFTPGNGYNNALVDAEAVLYKYDSTTLAQTNLATGNYFGNGQILTAPWPETRGTYPAVGFGFWNLPPTTPLRYKVRGGYWPAAPNPFVAVQGAWTDDL
jgi:hypothetical protein